MVDITYIVTVGPGELTRQSEWLLRSIRANTSATREDIVSFVANQESDRIPEPTIEYFDEHSVLLEGEIPDPEYPLSATHAALVRASEYSSNEYLVLLDTDTLVLDDIDAHRGSDADLLLVPESTTKSYWADMSRSWDAWVDLYDECDVPYPGPQLRSTVNDKEMLPYYNGGVIVQKNGIDFPERWRDLSERLHDSIEHSFYAEQVALGILSNEYDVREVSERYNYMQIVHIGPPPDDTVVVHYPDTISLYRALLNPTIKRKLQGTGAVEHFRNKTRREVAYNSLKSLIKAYVLSHPDATVSNLIEETFYLQRKVTNGIADRI